MRHKQKLQNYQKVLYKMVYRTRVIRLVRGALSIVQAAWGIPGSQRQSFLAGGLPRKVCALSLRRPKPIRRASGGSCVSVVRGRGGLPERDFFYAFMARARVPRQKAGGMAAFWLMSGASGVM